jgi:ABC-type nickel/cobalt efflux system permease component RcnA
MAVTGLLLLSFIYGIVHSLGPGHAKVLFLSHTLARPATIRQTWLAGGLFSLTHAGTSIVLFLVLRLLLGAGQGEIDRYSRNIVRLSGGLVLAAGVLIVVSDRLERVVHTSVQRLAKRASGLSTVAVFAGLAPCPGAFLILVFTSILGMLPAGLIAVGAVSAGMAVTVSSVTTAGGLLAARVATHHPTRRAAVAGRILRLAGAGMIMLLGVAMMLH